MKLEDRCNSRMKRTVVSSQFNALAGEAAKERTVDLLPNEKPSYGEELNNGEMSPGRQHEEEEKPAKMQ